MGGGFQLPQSKWVNKNPASSRKADSSMQPLPKEVEEMLAELQKNQEKDEVNRGADAEKSSSPNCFVWMGKLF